MLEDDTINKVSFVFIIEQEHRRNGFLNNGIWVKDGETYRVEQLLKVFFSKYKH